jgi:hypothetical protein
MDIAGQYGLICAGEYAIYNRVNGREACSVEFSPIKKIIFMTSRLDELV